MKNDSQQIVQKLWSYCNILRDDGLSYPDYVEQLTYLLFLKMAHEQAEAAPNRASVVPPGYDWQSLVSKNGEDLHKHYAVVLERLAGGQGMLGLIFRHAGNKIRDPAKLKLLVVDLIDKRNWSALDADVKGDAYEGLLEKNAQDTKSGAGQYFTPRPLIQAVVECVRPLPGETIYDPACGTCGFLLAAHDYIMRHHPQLTPQQERHLQLEAIRGVELVDAVTRLGAMNLLLHGIGSQESDQLPIETGDGLSAHANERFDVVLTNPPFGKRSSVTFTNEQGEREKQALVINRSDFAASSANKQLNFVQHILTALNPKGRAAVVVPDNILFEGGAGEAVRRRLLQEFDVHTLLRLPPGIFYASGVKANVLFFDQAVGSEKSSELSSRKLWIYDLRSNNHFTLRTHRLLRPELDDFVRCYNSHDRNERRETWSEQNPSGRWRSYTYDHLMAQDKCSFDHTWIREDAEDELQREPSQIANEIMADLRIAIEQLSEMVVDLDAPNKI